MTAQPLHTHVFGTDDPDAPVVLALHGLTGHGRRWGRLADHLPGVRLLAPDLLGHGHSSWAPPWGAADHATAVAETVKALVPANRSIVVVAHSFGSVVALALARRCPDLVAGLVLLDPAHGLDPAQARVYAEATLAHWGYADADAAIAAKRAEGWYDVPTAILIDELDHHLMSDDAGGVVWRVSPPAVATAWSEMARPFRLPPESVPTHVVVAGRVDPPFVRPEFLAACAAERPTTVTVHHVDTEHMVPFLAPDLCARLVLDLVHS
ncbi:alpha/beta fold hydrolase [Gordonia sp. HY285]|uniref:alpha/beta fold hydrolase n=1 Tax=Gordonia liuliyuniae TaxID=2911517 RepID=UPI001F37164A|nr:alpha/beta hydrolase [Gordonia liuliyuniae]MCF8609947.1 alpha/beta fold hydrolase [Gordonia liuliyuniae]